MITTEKPPQILPKYPQTPPKYPPENLPKKTKNTPKIHKHMIASGLNKSQRPRVVVLKKLRVWKGEERFTEDQH